MFVRKKRGEMKQRNGGSDGRNAFHQGSTSSTFSLVEKRTRKLFHLTQAIASIHRSWSVEEINQISGTAPRRRKVDCLQVSAVVHSTWQHVMLAKFRTPLSIFSLQQTLLHHRYPRPFRFITLCYVRSMIISFTRSAAT